MPPSPPFPFGSRLFPVAEGCREAEEHPRMIPKPAACRKRVGLGRRRMKRSPGMRHIPAPGKPQLRACRSHRIPPPGVPMSPCATGGEKLGRVPSPFRLPGITRSSWFTWIGENRAGANAVPTIAWLPGSVGRDGQRRQGGVFQRWRNPVPAKTSLLLRRDPAGAGGQGAAVPRVPPAIGRDRRAGSCIPITCRDRERRRGGGGW